METKIINSINGLLILVLSSCWPNAKPSFEDKRIDAAKFNDLIKYDTIFYSHEDAKRIRTFAFTDSIKFTEGAMLLRTSGGGMSVWIDEILYQAFYKNSLIIVNSGPGDRVNSLFYYNGDSLIAETVAINRPSVKEYVFNKFNVLSIVDSSYNSGYLIKSMLFYKIDKQGRLIERREFFLSKKVEEQRYDFETTVLSYPDSLLILRDGIKEASFSD